MAAIQALQALTRPCEVTLHTDSKYVLQGITEWLPNWKRRGWKTASKQAVKNEDLWRLLDSAAQQHTIQWQWVKGIPVMMGMKWPISWLIKVLTSYDHNCCKREGFYEKTLDIALLGEPVLRQIAAPMDTISAGNTCQLVENMLFTLKDSGGVGLAAPQVFESTRLIVVASKPTKRYPYAPEMAPTVMLNPEFTALTETMEKDWEGCLSIPGIGLWYRVIWLFR